MMMIHADEMHGAIPRNRSTSTKALLQIAGELALTHLAGGHGKLAVAHLALADRMTIDLDVIRRVQVFIASLARGEAGKRVGLGTAPQQSR